MTRPPETVIFFIDECLDCDAVFEAIKAACSRHTPPPSIERHRSHFKKGALDVDWLPAVGAKGWIVLTKDKAIRKHELELAALRQAGVGAFILTAKNLSGDNMGEAFSKATRAMLRTVAKQMRPFIARVTKSGDVDLIGESVRASAVKRDSTPVE